MAKLPPPRHVVVVHTTEHEGTWHTFAFAHDERLQAQALRNVGIMASNPELPFSWADAARVSEAMREQFNEMNKKEASSADGQNPGFNRRLS